MFSIIKSLLKENRIFAVPLAIILIVIFFTLLVKSYFFSTITSNWEEVSKEKKSEVSSKCLDIFYSYQNDLNNYAAKLSSDKRFVSSLISQNSKKAYDALYEIPGAGNYSLEIYNSRLELFMFDGRQLNPEFLELKKALEGSRFSIVKDIGLYTYLIVYSPVKGENGVIEGVAIAGSIIDINSNIQNTYFENRSITREIFKSNKINVDFDFDNIDSQNSPGHENYTRLPLKGIDSSNIGSIFIPTLDKESYLSSIETKFDNLISFLLFSFSVILIIWEFSLLGKLKSILIKITALTITLILARYLWLWIDFPSGLFTDFGTEFFSPVYYASGYGFGAAKSLGELTITAAMLFVCSFVIFYNSIVFYRKEKKLKKDLRIALPLFVFCAIVVFVSVQFYGLVIESMINDSTIRFIDKSDLFSFDQTELIISQMILILFSLSLLFILCSAALLSLKYAAPFITRSKFARKNSSVLFILLLCIMIPAAMFAGIDFSMVPGLMFLIFVIFGLFLYYLHRKLTSTRNYSVVNISAFSIMLLSCVVFIPVIILTKITSQENRYLEKAARDISQRNDDKAGFLVTSAINELSLDEQLAAEIKNRNKIGNLAFTLWSTSSLNDEDVNSAIYILDSNKKSISDFSIIPSDLNQDSVINYVFLESEGTGNFEQEAGEEEADSLSNDIDAPANMHSLVSEPGIVLNKENKYYAGIITIASGDIVKPRFRKNLGYVVVVCSFDSKNYIRQGNLSIFRSFARENILNKLTSAPVFSEFSYDEIAGSSNMEVSKAFLKSLPAFRESVKDKPVKSALRYDQFENETYKSIYVLTDAHQNVPERIYVASIKVNDFALSSFFFFRFLLFTAAVFLIILIFYAIVRIVRIIFKAESISSLRFGFREKLFVSFLAASVIPIIILALYTREYVKTKNDESYRNQLISDLRLIEQYVKNREHSSVGSEKRTSKDAGSQPFKDVFGKELSESNRNFNLYFKNKIAATTSEQLYKSDLLDSRISGKSYYNIALLKKDFYTENQQIGDFTFIAGYKPVYDSYNYLYGIISTQTVFKQNEINQELTESLVYILGPYIAAVIMLVFLLNVLSYRISNPILKLQKATEQLSKGIIDVEVRSKTEDEIGNLIKSFNRMVKELKRAQDELKIAERETAWRDIARQVAHEIKNPLTPMKLAMQHLYSSYTSGSKNFKTILASTNKMIIDQIETLNKIATEFSAFAKLPGKNYEMLNADEILKDVVQLMNTKRNIELNVSENGKNEIWGDKDELRRAIINIVKNSLQAIDEIHVPASKGKVIINSNRENGNYHLLIKDNGCGMDKKTKEKLFEPYFSTKSSGMGLGLVITKKILDDMKAKINVNSEAGKGTEVEIVFKLRRL